MHTIKGSAAMFGLERIATFAHDVESILSALREGKIPVTKELVGNTLMARDMILEMLDSPKDATGPMSPEMAEFLDAFRLSVGFMAEAPGPSGKAARVRLPTIRPRNRRQRPNREPGISRLLPPRTASAPGGILSRS
jgi:two-component system chemotaxis sensor kinase CheA